MSRLTHSLADLYALMQLTRPNKKKTYQQLELVPVLETEKDKAARLAREKANLERQALEYDY